MGDIENIKINQSKREGILLAEKKRLKENRERTRYWKHWGPYLAERQWGTVREDYSQDGKAWDYFTYEMALSRTYRWGEDGIAGISDTHQRICFALAFWNEQDPFIKERLFGLANLEGNHGEDVKEYYYLLDNTPTHTYMKYLYKYPHACFPYDEIRRVNKERTQRESEYELIDTKIFDHDRYFDIFVEYAKDQPDDIYIRITIYNRSQEEKKLHLLPTLWLRNTWFNEQREKPYLRQGKKGQGFEVIEIFHPELGKRFLYAESAQDILFTQNESQDNANTPYTKGGINAYITLNDSNHINPHQEGTKATIHYILHLLPKGNASLVLRLTPKQETQKPLHLASKIMKLRLAEADAFYHDLLSSSIKEDHRLIARQALAGMLWNKMYYHYIIPQWLKGDSTFSPQLPPHDFEWARNRDWLHLYCDDIVSVPDKWEFPAFFSWDSAFHSIPLAMIDPDFAKNQLSLLTQGWYMHPNGMLPAYEWNFFDVNPPVHAWASWRVYKIDQRYNNQKDRLFLERVFHKLLLNFTWWVNRKDASGKNIFQGGFLGLDNISIFNRSKELPPGATLYQSDATSWMGMFCVNMLTMAFELAQNNQAYEDMANKFYNHFLFIADAINFVEKRSHPLWNADEGFYYDVLRLADGKEIPLKVRSLVGLIPLLAVATIEKATLDRLSLFKKKMNWFIQHRKDLCSKVACMRTPGVNERRILAIVDRFKIIQLLKVMLDEDEFLSPYGIRSVSKYHEKHPFVLDIDGKSYSVDYEPGESTNRLFGGNSNWRGPIWFPINVLIIESLQKFYHYYGEELKVECPTGSGQMMTLWQVAAELAHRLLRLFEVNKQGKRPVFGDQEKFQNDPAFKDYILFHEYFHGDTGKGLGASHQMGWTGFIAKLIKQLGDYGAI